LSRIEKIGKRLYAKIPTSTEKKLVDIVNNYFDSGTCSSPCGDLTEEQKQLIMNEIINRLYPVINQISSDVAEQIVEEAVDRIIQEFSGINDYITNEEYTRYSYDIVEGDPLDKVIIPGNVNLFLNKGEINVTVNGMEQYYMENYTLGPNTTNPALIGYISFW
jgi:hypothetical protein